LRKFRFGCTNILHNNVATIKDARSHAGVSDDTSQILLTLHYIRLTIPNINYDPNTDWRIERSRNALSASFSGEGSYSLSELKQSRTIRSARCCSRHQGASGCRRGILGELAFHRRRCHCHSSPSASQSSETSRLRKGRPP
jgi:hypothetical protein